MERLLKMLYRCAALDIANKAGAAATNDVLPLLNQASATRAMSGNSVAVLRISPRSMPCVTSISAIFAVRASRAGRKPSLRHDCDPGDQCRIFLPDGDSFRHRRFLPEC